MNTIITGEVQSGKTTWCLQYSHWLSERKYTVGGILCTEILSEGYRIGYDVSDIQANRSYVFGRLSSIADFTGEPVGRYTISFEGIKYAEKAIQSALQNKCDMVFLDEVGYLELAGKGIFRIAKSAYQTVFNTTTVVRKSLLTSFLNHFNKTEPAIDFIIKDISSDPAFYHP